MPPLNQRGFYTTGEMAKALRVSQQTVTRWIDAGELKAYRLPGSQRRCSKSVFRQYLVDYEVPLEWLEQMEQGSALATVQE